MELPEGRYEAHELARQLTEGLEERLDDAIWPEVPDSARAIMEKYESRGAALGPYWRWMPDEIRHFRVLKEVGTPKQLREERDAILDSLDRASDTLYFNMAEEEGYLWGTFETWVEERYGALLQRAEAAEAALEANDLTIEPVGDGKYRLERRGTGGNREMFRNRVVKELYRHMHSRFVEAWPSEAADNPQRLRKQVQTLLRPHVGGELPLDTIHSAFRNA